ncbi:MAG: hypothetical protein H6Q89_4217 [Myxococcaceae bacterium]|nr:hypothetical protein [Myxococcaceae bacterium]
MSIRRTTRRPHAEVKQLKEAERATRKQLKPEVSPAAQLAKLARLVDGASANKEALQPTDGSRAQFAGLPTLSGRFAQQLATDPSIPVGQKPVGPPEDLSQAQVFGRPVDPRSSHDLFWNYFGGRASPTNNDEARAMMKEMADKFAPFGFKVEPVEHERMDKILITGPDGKQEQVDFIFSMGGKPGEQRLQWLPSNPVGPGAKGGAVDSGFVLGIFSAFPPTNDGMRKALEELKKQKGYEATELLEHAQRLDKLKFSNGQIVDVIIGAGGNNPQWGWLPE